MEGGSRAGTEATAQHTITTRQCSPSAAAGGGLRPLVGACVPQQRGALLQLSPPEWVQDNCIFLKHLRKSQKTTRAHPESSEQQRAKKALKAYSGLCNVLPSEEGEERRTLTSLCCGGSWPGTWRALLPFIFTPRVSCYNDLHSADTYSCCATAGLCHNAEITTANTITSQAGRAWCPSLGQLI